MSKTVLELNGIVKRYKRCVALDGLSLKVPKGSVFGLVGSNGAGKTTALSVAAGIVKANSGSINLFGGGSFDVLRDSGRISLMPQDADMPLHSKVIDVLLFYAELQGASKSAAKKNAVDILKRVHLEDRAESTIRSLSHGMKRRVVIAQAFLGNPELVLMDEPMSGLDPTEVVNIRNILLNCRDHQTIVVSSHNLTEIEKICNHIAFIEKGRNVRQGTMDGITSRASVINYLIDSPSVDLEKLADSMDDLTLNLDPDGNGFYCLTCEFSCDIYSAAEVNKNILSFLLERKIGILSVKQGMELEETYMRHTVKGRS